MWEFPFYTQHIFANMVYPDPYHLIIFWLSLSSVQSWVVFSANLLVFSHCLIFKNAFYFFTFCIHDIVNNMLFILSKDAAYWIQWIPSGKPLRRNERRIHSEHSADTTWPLLDERYRYDTKNNEHCTAKHRLLSK